MLLDLLRLQDGVLNPFTRSSLIGLQELMARLQQRAILEIRYIVVVVGRVSSIIWTISKTWALLL
jgi:hypothetical protein